MYKSKKTLLALSVSIVFNFTAIAGEVNDQGNCSNNKGSCNKTASLNDFIQAAGGLNNLRNGVVLNCDQNKSACDRLATCVPAPNQQCTNAWQNQDIYIRKLSPSTPTRVATNTTASSIFCLIYTINSPASVVPAGLTRGYDVSSSEVTSSAGQIILPLFNDASKDRILVCETSIVQSGEIGTCPVFGNNALTFSPGP